MGAHSKIEWTDHTFSPWWGCTRVSPGCEHCYADAFSKRVGYGGETSPRKLPVLWGPRSERRFFGDKHWAEPLKWARDAAKAGQRRRVFCASMADVFEERPDLVGPRARLAGLIRETTHLDWLLLTKRPGNASRLWAGAWAAAWDGGDSIGFEWAPNIWLGTTAEDQQRADERIPHLLAVPAAVRFVSNEPALGPVNLSQWMWPLHWTWDRRFATPEDAIASGARASQMRQALVLSPARFVDWVIVGGESGGGARPFDLAWARSTIAQCKAAGVAVFVKQMGANRVAASSHGGTAVVSPELSRISRGKGGDWSEWPEDLRVREYPTARSAVSAVLTPQGALFGGT